MKRLLLAVPLLAMWFVAAPAVLAECGDDHEEAAAPMAVDVRVPVAKAARSHVAKLAKVNELTPQHTRVAGTVEVTGSGEDTVLQLMNHTKLYR